MNEQSVVDISGLDRKRRARAHPKGRPVEPQALADVRMLLSEAPLTLPAFRAALSERFPAHDAAALAYACRNHLALVQVPPRGLLGRSHQVTVTTAEAWLDRPLAASPSLDDLVLRYLVEEPAKESAPHKLKRVGPRFRA